MRGLYPDFDDLRWIRATNSALSTILISPRRIYVYAVQQRSRNQAELGAALTPYTLTQALRSLLAVTFWKAVSVIAFGLLLVTFTVSEMGSSCFAGIIAVFGQLLYCSLDIASSRALAGDEGLEDDENTWGFGQVLPLLLLLLPILDILQKSTVRFT